MGPKFGAQKGNKLGSQLGPMSITKLSPNWACQMVPIHCHNFLLSGLFHCGFYTTHLTSYRICTVIMFLSLSELAAVSGSNSASWASFPLLACPVFSTKVITTSVSYVTITILTSQQKTSLLCSLEI